MESSSNTSPIKSNSKSKFLLLSGVDFEKRSSASYSRISNYAFALELGGRALQVSSYLSSNIYIYDKSMDASVIPIFSLHYKHKPSKYLLYRLLLKELDFVNMFLYLASVEKYCRNNNISSLLLYQGNFALTLSALIYGKLFNKKIVLEKNELAVANRMNYQMPKGIFQRINFCMLQVCQVPVKLAEDLLAVFFDDVIVISTRLERLYNSFRFTKTVRIPILSTPINILSTQPHATDAVTAFKICYAGTITENKDALYSVIVLMQDEEIKNLKCELHIYGDLSKVSMANLGIDRNGKCIYPCVYYHGVLHHEQLMLELQSYDLLLLLRRYSIQSQYGFSTKLAEYLSTAVPVLATSISDIDTYLRDGENGFLIDYHKLSPEEIKIKLLEILHCENLQNIGRLGRETAEKYFNPSDYSNQLVKLFSKGKS